jgi:hypothetical protein
LLTSSDDGVGTDKRHGTRQDYCSRSILYIEICHEQNQIRTPQLSPIIYHTMSSK